MRIMIVGGHGELGQALAEVCRVSNFDALPLGREGCDVTDGESCLRAVKFWTPDVIVNCAAYHKVDRAETDGHTDAVAVNTYGAANVAIAARECKARVVFVSTDYVFDGTAITPYLETSEPNPLNRYGFSKLGGELATQNASTPSLVVRTAGLFGGHGKSQKGGDFFRRLIARSKKEEPLAVVDDITTSLTYVPDLAGSILRLVESGAEGIRHVVNAGGTTWHHAGTTCLMMSDGLPRGINRLAQAELSSAAQRPTYSVLGSTSEDVLELPKWWERLSEYVRFLKATGE